MQKGRRESLLAMLLARLRKQPALPKRIAPARPFQAISIFKGVHACEMARKFSEHRFLARDAPQLPLSGCTRRDACDCSYIRHRDRRGEPRRVVDFGSVDRAYSGANRRKQRGRRATDQTT
jgi:hypothetical protein